MASNASGETFGGRLKRLREEAGLTQQGLADKAEMHRLGVAKLERDERQPSWATVQALARALGVNCLAFEGTVAPPEERQPAKKGRPRTRLPEPEEPADPAETPLPLALSPPVAEDAGGDKSPEKPSGAKAKRKKGK